MSSATASPTSVSPTSASTSRATAARAVAGYGALDLRRLLRDKVSMFFVVGLPTFMYVVFGLGSTDTVGSGNVAMYVMVSMAAYGAVSATTSIAGSAATERTMGWGRQLALTPLRPATFLALKTALAMVVATVPIGLIYALGALTGAEGSRSDWLLSALVVWAGSALFAVFGLAMCLLLRTQNADGIASGLIVIMAFLGNVFSPMSGLILDIGRLTPLYGYAALARYPLTEGRLPDGSHESLWLPLANVLAWTVIFAGLALWGVRRGRERV